MYIHNTTFIVDSCLVAQFLDWARLSFIPEARDSGYFNNVTMARILTEIQPDTVNIAIQMTAQSLNETLEWHAITAAPLIDDLIARLGANRVMFFATSMEIIP